MQNLCPSLQFYHDEGRRKEAADKVGGERYNHPHSSCFRRLTLADRHHSRMRAVDEHVRRMGRHIESSSGRGRLLPESVWRLFIFCFCY